MLVCTQTGTAEEAAGCSGEMGTNSTSWSWEQTGTAREQGTSTVPETSASTPGCTPLTPSLAGKNGKGQGEVRVETLGLSYSPPC